MQRLRHGPILPADGPADHPAEPVHERDTREVDPATAPPPMEVLEAFGLRGPARSLAGGQRRTFEADGAVLKVADDAAEAAWVQDLAARLDPTIVRVARPLPTTDGSWTHDSWTASVFVRGLSPAAPDWATVTDAGRRFTEAASTIEDLDTRVLRTRTHRWARADRCAWAEEAITLTGRAEHLQVSLRQLTIESDQPNQVIHGDLAGNVHLDEDGRPVVLDISPFVRPARWGDAIVVADAVTWRGGSPALATAFADDSAGVDLLARALIFRLVAEQLGGVGANPPSLEPYERLVGLLRVAGPSTS